MDKDVDGYTPLHVSMKYDNVIVTNYFLEKCQLNLKQIESTIIYIAAEKCSSEMIRLLLKYDIVVGTGTLCGHSPLEICVLARNADAAKVFIEKLSDVNSYLFGGRTLLYVSVEKDLLEIVKLLIKRGADINVKSDKSATVLHAACLSGCYQMLKFLLENGANTDINSVNADGATPLYIAARNGDYKVIKLLLDCGADPNIAHRILKSTVLHRLSEYGHAESVELILNHIRGDLIIKIDVNSRIPADYAAENGHIQILKLLLNSRHSSIDRERSVRSPLFVGALNGHLNVVKILIDQTSDIDFALDPLIAAAEKGHIDIIKFLLGKKFDWYKSNLPNIQTAVDHAASKDD